MHTQQLGRVGGVRTDTPKANGDNRQDGQQRRAVTDEAGYMAEQLCLGFKHHDDRNREACVAAFHAVDRLQFPGVDDETARAAAAAFADSLWAKDDVEAPYVDGRELVDPEGLDAADWSPVRNALALRAELLGIDEAYAEETTAAWRRHKTGGDYWTPTLRAQQHELRVALDDPSYPDKNEFGGSGFGSLAARYLVAVECHDAHTESRWAEALEVMTPYFAEILDARGDGE